MEDAAINYYKRHLGDYAKDTRHLTTYQHGVYAVLLDWYYASEKPIPIDLVYRIVQARSGPERRSCDEVLATCFDLCKAPTFAHNKRADIDIAKCRSKSLANSLIALERETTKRARNVVETCSERARNVNQAISHKPIAIKEQEKKTAPSGVDHLFDGVDPQVVADFKTLRNKLRAPVTQTAVDGIKREADKAGVSLEVALALCCARGWRGFKAEWLAGDTAAAVASAPGGGRVAL